MDIPLCLSPIEATDANYNGDMSDNGFYPPEAHTLDNNHKHESVNRIARQNLPKSMSLPAITDPEVNFEIRKTIVEWRGTRARRNTEEEKRQTWRRSLNSPIRKFFWTDVVPREQNMDGDMSVDALMEENAVCDGAESDECMFISRDKEGHPVFSPAIHAARQAENEEAVEENFVDSKEDTPMDDLESIGGNETTDSENTTEQEHLAERVQVLSIQGV